MYESQTFDAIMSRLLSVVPNDLDKREGSFIWDALAPAAIELAQAYAELDNVINLGFAQTTYGQYLDYRAGEHGLTRKAATKATGQVTVSGAQGTTVAKGSLFATGSGTQFVTTEAATIDSTGQAIVPIEATEAGVSGNVPAGTIVSIPVSLPGVTAVTNAEATTGGTDQESDEDLLVRYLEVVQHPVASGNVWDYSQWAKEVTGVGDAKVIPTWNGPGTVKVILIDTNKQPASADIVSAVEVHIEEERPIGATVTVVPAVSLPVDVTATITRDLAYTLDQVKANFQAKLAEYLDGIAFKSDTVSYAQVGNALLNTDGVKDYQALQVNGGTVNIAVGDDQVPVVGTVTLSE